MQTITINSAEYEIKETGLANVPYNFVKVGGKQVLRGMRNYHHPEIIIILDKGCRELGKRIEGTWKPVV